MKIANQKTNQSASFHGLLWEFGPLFFGVFTFFLALWRASLLDIPLIHLLGIESLGGRAALGLMISLLIALMVIGGFVYATLGIRKSKGPFKLLPGCALPFLLGAVGMLATYYVYYDIKFDNWQF